MISAADQHAARLRVTAVVVSHNGAAWLPKLLSALEESTLAPDIVVGADTGSGDGSATILIQHLGRDRVVALDGAAGFGAAVARALLLEPDLPRHGRPAEPIEYDEWLWLLHDDCAPAPDALGHLLDAAASAPDIAGVGCRLRAWPRGRRLLEVGVTISGTGRRVTGLEPGEYDQGQYDATRDVLAVSSAGMLVRRRVWDELGGFDPQLPLFRDDVDFGWRATAAGYRVLVAPHAVLFHVEASARSIRAGSLAPRPRRADREAALFTILANGRRATLPLVYVRLLAGSLIRVLGLLLAKLPGAAGDELVAAASVLGRPWRLVPARRARRSTRRRPASSVRHLRPAWWSPYASGLDVVLEVAGSVAGSARRLRGGAGLLRQPLLVLLAVLTLAALIASRGLWGAGFLQGGALPPAPDSAGHWWTLSTQAWHPVGLGSWSGTAPYVALLALPATVLVGKAWLLVDVIMLGAVPLAAVGAWCCSRRLVRGTSTRLWMALGFALTPVVTGAVTSGHLGTVAVAVLLPWIARSAVPLLDTEAAPSWGAAWATGLWLAIATAFAPVCWPIAALVGTVAMTWHPRHSSFRMLSCWLVALVTPLVVLAPWSGRVIRHPGLLLTEAGVVDVPGAPIGHAAWQLAFGRIGAAGAAPWWFGIGLTVAAVAALFRRDTRTRVAGCWVVIAAALLTAALMWRQPVELPLGSGQAYPWLGVPVLVATAGAIAAAGVAADGLRGVVQAGSFGWRQPLAVIVAAAAVLGPALGLGWWIGTAAHGELRRGVAISVPAYMVDAMESSGQRVLVLHADGRTLRYEVLGGDGLRLGDDSVLPAKADPRLTPLIGDLVSPGHPGTPERLAQLGIGYVVVPAASRSPALTRSVDGQLDALAGLTRTSTDEVALSGWQVEGVAAKPVSTALVSGGSRDGWLFFQGAAWLALVVLAAPGAGRDRIRAQAARG